MNLVFIKITAFRINTFGNLFLTVLIKRNNWMFACFRLDIDQLKRSHTVVLVISPE